MKILIEDFPYKPESVSMLSGELPFVSTKNGVCCRKVGYFFSQTLNDAVFILPKVILKAAGNNPPVDFDNEEEPDADSRDTVFSNHCDPNDIIDVSSAYESGLINQSEFDFLGEFSIRIYRSINEFLRKGLKTNANKTSNVVSRKTFSAVSLNGETVGGGLLDIILSLVAFAEENRDFILFSIKNIFGGCNNISWSKTISNIQPVFFNDSPVYLNFINRKRVADFEEELLVIFYSILNYAQETYLIHCATPSNFELITGQRFKMYMEGYGLMRLMQIKHRFFSDKTLKIWNLCRVFFELSERFSASHNRSEYLLVSKFDVVFESMVDYLISDADVPRAMRNQKDGKMVDHLFVGKSLIFDSNIYCIADSKYYKSGGAVHGTAHYKQYTYARNVIQCNIDMLRRKQSGAFNYIDPLTRGYDVTPNFFISAQIDSQFRSDSECITLRECYNGSNVERSYHFKNSLFDRDTFWVAHFDINFLFVLNMFVSGGESSRNRFKDKLKTIFRERLLEILNHYYDFYEYTCSTVPVECFVKENFHKLIGKFRFGNDRLVLALESNNKESERIFSEFKDSFTKFTL